MTRKPSKERHNRFEKTTIWSSWHTDREGLVCKDLDPALFHIHWDISTGSCALCVPSPSLRASVLLVPCIYCALRSPRHMLALSRTAHQQPGPPLQSELSSALHCLCSRSQGLGIRGVHGFQNLQMFISRKWNNICTEPMSTLPHTVNHHWTTLNA